MPIDDNEAKALDAKAASNVECENPRGPEVASPETESASCKASLRALDALNLCLADVQTGVGPYLAIFLQSNRHWNAARVGTAIAAGGIAGVLTQTPLGACIDRTRWKRFLVVVAVTLVGVGALMIALLPTFWAVIAAQIIMGTAGAVFPPAIAALSLGLVGYSKLNMRAARNEAFNHGGNVIAAIAFGLIGFYIARAGIFYFVAVLTLAAIIAVLKIDEADIDHARARGEEQQTKENDTAPDIANLGALFAERKTLIFALAVVLFHSANAAMLPLVGEQLAKGAQGQGGRDTLYMSACIIVSQLVMVPVDVLIARWAPQYGRKPIFLIGFIVLPLRGILFALLVNPYALVSVQILDGISAGIFGVLSVLVIADLTRGTGRFNFLQGAIATATGIGASASNLLAGIIVKHSSYRIGFLTLAAIAGIALAFFWLAMPETKNDD